MNADVELRSASKGPVPELEPGDAFERQRAGALLLDVRDDAERATGMPAGSVGLALSSLAQGIDVIAPDRGREILAICGSGQRSLRAAAELRELGYARSSSVNGGFARWRHLQLPVREGTIVPDFAERYARHLVLPEVGVDGQQRLAQSRVLLVGAGGLGSPAALYLAAAGVGTLTIVDDDRVERSNLQRQVIHTDARVGTPKVESARLMLGALNPTVRVEAVEARVSAANVEDLLRGHDVVIDGADNFPTRYLLNAASLHLRIPLVYGAVHRFSGQASVFDPRRADSPCYRCLFPEPPSADEAPNCSEAGVLGVLPGIIGLFQANEALKLLLGFGKPLVGRLLCYDALDASSRELRLARDPACPGCGAHALSGLYVDIARICAGS